MRTENLDFGMTRRIAEVWPWIVALDAWTFCDAEPLAELINSKTIPVEITPAIAELVSGKRKQNKRGAAKLKIDPKVRMEIGWHASRELDMIERMKFDDHFYKIKDVGGQADILGIEPIEAINELNEKARKIIHSLAVAYDVSTETIENLVRDYRKKIKDWPSV